VPRLREIRSTLRTASAALLLVAASGAYGAERSQTSCADLWRKQQWREVDQPIWVSPSLPDQGVVPKLKMRALVDANDNRFVPGNLEESNCFLDRVLDDKTRAAIKGAGSALARVDRPDMDDDVDLLLDDAARRVDAAAGIKESSPAGTLTSILVNLQSLYGIRPGPVSDPGPFLRYVYSQRLYNSYTVTWYVLLAYVEHLGVRPVHMETYLRQLRARDAEYAPPNNLRVEGCVIDYKWPHIERPLPSQADLPAEAALHFGVCRATRTVWFYQAAQGWRPLGEELMDEFCSSMGSDEDFADVCRR
jgi:hypothetical protein